MRPPMRASRSLLASAWLALALTGLAGPSHAGEPDAARYWKVDDVRVGMKGTGRTVMVGTKLEEFGAEVLGVMKGVSPGRDMILCRLTGCNLEHAGIIQGMSGSPIYVDGKLLGAVAFAWEFAKDPIAGVTPFEQMVAYVRAGDRRLTAEAAGAARQASIGPAFRGDALLIDQGDRPINPSTSLPGPTPTSGGGLAGMQPIATPLAATGFSPRALAVLEERLRPLGMAPMAGGAVTKAVLEAEGNKPLSPGAPLSIAMVTGDFDISGIGTVTHVEGDRVYGFGHPMMSLGACEFPMMTGYIHTVYPRASVSMKMGSPLKVVGVLDTDVSTGIAGKIGPRPDMLPVSVHVKTGQFADARDYHVEMVRESNLMPTLVMSVLTNAIDTEGNLPEELTARIKAVIKLKGHDPIVFDETLSGPRYTGMMGPAALFSPVATIVNLLMKNPFEKVRIEAIDCDVNLLPGRTLATLESVRLASDRVEPGETLDATATIKPFKGERETRTIRLPIPAELPEGNYELTVSDATMALRRRLRNEPGLTEPVDLHGLLKVIRVQTEPKRTTLYAQVPLPDRGLAVDGQTLPSLPSSARALFASARQTQDPPVRGDLHAGLDTPWVVEGVQNLKFQVVKHAGISLK